MELSLLREKFERDLEVIETSDTRVMERSNMSISLCHDCLHLMRKHVLEYGFINADDEVNFFKRTKQVPLVSLIYYSEIYSIEVQFPKGDMDYQLKFIKHKVKSLNRFFQYNIDFGHYINSGAVHFDKEFFTRDSLKTFHLTMSKFYYQDPEFCTPKDMLLGKYRAYDALMIYLCEKKISILKGFEGTFDTFRPIEKISWPFTNTDWVELIYALSSAGVTNKNNLSISKVSNTLQKVFDFTPKDIYKTYQDIKNRKNSRTIFLDELTTSLLSAMNKSEM